MPLTKAIQRIVSYATHVTDPDRIILFGSFASGNTNVYSDVDLLIVTTNMFQRRAVEHRIASYARECAIRADVLMRTPEEIHRAEKSPLSFVASVLRTGRVVYDRKSA